MLDVIIIGAGPAGLGASIYASRYKLSHVVIGEQIGGQVTEAWKIENYAGFESISGKDLMERFKVQAKDLGATLLDSTVLKINKITDGFQIVTTDDKKFEARALILALGMKPKKLNIPNENKFLGKGVSYCATCDAMFFRGKDVVVIGGGDSAATAAIHLAEFANSVQLLYKTGTKVYEPSWDEQIIKTGKIGVSAFEKIEQIIGEQKVQGLHYLTSEGQAKEIEVAGIFIEIGSVPSEVIIKELGIETDEQGYVKVAQDQLTNIENIWAAGDLTTGSNKFRQIITAVAEGAVAAGSVYKKIKLNATKK